MATGKRVFLTFLSFVLAFGLMPLPAFADDVGTPDSDDAVEGAFDPEDAQADAPGFGDAVVVDLADIAFVYVESPSVPVDSVQNIVVGFADDALVADAAELDLASPAGDIVTIGLSDAVEGAVLFAVDASALDVGEYSITELRYRVADDGTARVAPFFQDDAVHYAFEVVGGAEEAADGSGPAIEAYTISPDGEYIQTDSIASAMAAAGVDPDKGPSAAVESDDGALTTQSSDGFVIVLDPGHGGSDGGATGIGFYEKDVNLKIAQYCKAKLEQTPGVTVYMTRTSDATVSLQDRVSFAVTHNADLVVSLHNNASGGRGSEVIVPRNGSWYYQETYVTGTELGKAILSKLNALGLPTHGGVYSRDCTSGETYPDGTLSDYYTLIDGPRYEGILGIIVEHAFVDNESDAAFLRDEGNLKRLGEADAQAIVDYYNTSDGIARLYWGVYDYDYYTSHYPDVKAQAGSSKINTLAYFKKNGMAAGQRANVLFDVEYYKSHNADLQKAFGNDLERYYAHFLENGMSEGRQGSADFSPAYYKAAYSDLRAAFGNDWKAYYNHYVTSGAKEGRTAVGSAPAADTTVTKQPLYRLYQPATGEHHYTLDAHERDVCVAQWGWRYEGIAWYCPSRSATPVYRLYNSATGLHHYTTDAYERSVCVSRWGWTYEGVAWYSDDSHGVPLYRLYQPSSGHHHYTMDAYERSVCISKWGWRDESIAWYGMN